MPVSKKRKKKGKAVKSNEWKRARRLEAAIDERPAGVSLQDLINVVAYQEYKEQGLYDVETTGLPPGSIIEDCTNPECPQAGNCHGECVRNFTKMTEENE